MTQRSFATPSELPFGRRLTAHVERHLGPINGVLHPPDCMDRPIDLLWVGVAPGRNFQTLVTCGMSYRPMTMSRPRCSCSAFAELLLRLPVDWPIVPGSVNRWPLELLVALARFPHSDATHLGCGHTIKGVEDPQARFAGSVLRDPTWAPRRFRQLRLDRTRRLDFFGVIPLYDDELEFAYGEGTETLFEHLDLAGVTDLLNVDRPNLFEPIH